MKNYAAMSLQDALKELEGGLAMACNDSAADVVRRARDEINRLRERQRRIEVPVKIKNFGTQSDDYLRGFEDGVLAQIDAIKALFQTKED